jgi:hypothetical protein
VPREEVKPLKEVVVAWVVGVGSAVAIVAIAYAIARLAP